MPPLTANPQALTTSSGLGGGQSRNSEARAGRIFNPARCGWASARNVRSSPQRYFATLPLCITPSAHGRTVSGRGTNAQGRPPRSTMPRWRPERTAPLRRRGAGRSPRRQYGRPLKRARRRREIVTLDLGEPDPQGPCALPQRYNIHYTALLAAETRDLHAQVPQAVSRRAWPTSFFLGPHPPSGQKSACGALSFYCLSAHYSQHTAYRGDDRVTLFYENDGVFPAAEDPEMVGGPLGLVADARGGAGRMDRRQTDAVKTPAWRAPTTAPQLCGAALLAKSRARQSRSWAVRRRAPAMPRTRSLP